MSKAKVRFLPASFIAKLICTLLLLFINYKVYAAHDGDSKKSGGVILHEVSLYKGKDLVFRGSQQTLAGESAYFNLEQGSNGVGVSVLISSDIRNGFLLSDRIARQAPSF